MAGAIPHFKGLVLMDVQLMQVSFHKKKQTQYHSQQILWRLYRVSTMEAEDD